jgi:hypothetical protein
VTADATRRTDTTDLQPDVLIVGGFMTYPPAYLPLRSRLLAGGAHRVEIAPLWPHDWLLATVRGLAPAIGRVRLAAERLHQRGSGRPIVLVGHSAGGVLARLATSPEPFEGQAGDLAPLVGAIVTLGSPHAVLAEPWRGHRAGPDVAAFLDTHVPGAYFEPWIGYVTVGSSLVQGAGWRSGWRSGWAGQTYSMLLGDEARLAAGDGMVPLSAAHLDGARQLSFDDVLHGHLGTRWYGDQRVLDRWWPVALEAWRDALHARATRPAPWHLAPSSPRLPEATLLG